MLEVVGLFEHREKPSVARGQALFTSIPVQALVHDSIGDSLDSVNQHS